MTKTKDKAIKLLGEEMIWDIWRHKTEYINHKTYLQMHSKAVEVVVELLKYKETQEQSEEELKRQLNEATEFAMRKGRRFDKLNTVKNLEKEGLFDELQSAKLRMRELLDACKVALKIAEAGNPFDIESTDLLKQAIAKAEEQK